MTVPQARQRAGAQIKVTPMLQQPSTLDELSAETELLKQSRRFFWGFGLPCLLYTVCFFVLTYPNIWLWSSCFYCNNGDGLQNVWNIWWIHKAIVELHQSPWHTNWLHYPYGTTLIGHTLNPLNGFIGILLGCVCSSVQVHNLIVTGTFVFSGLTAFWLAFQVVGQYWPAIAAGYAFTFTGHHFAHGEGHMQLISMEFIPLFLLCWLRLLRRPSYGWAIGAGVSLMAVMLCDFYYVFYCVLAGILAALCYASHLWSIWRTGTLNWQQILIPFVIFVAVAGTLCGPLAWTLVEVNKHDQLLGAHSAEIFSADPLAIVIPGGHSLLGKFTEAYWSKIPGYPSEQSVELGIAVVLMATWGVITRRRTSTAVWFWVFLAVIAYLLSLGPSLHFHGDQVTRDWMPYAGLEWLVPAVKLSGCPVRITVMVALAVSVLAACGLSAVASYSRALSIFLTSIFWLAMVAELWPLCPTTYYADVPHWTEVLRSLPAKGAVLSLLGDTGEELYFQTLFNRPISFGYISRLPLSVSNQDQQIQQEMIRGHFYELRHDYGFVYVILPSPHGFSGLPVVYADKIMVIQELPATLPYTDFHL